MNTEELYRSLVEVAENVPKVYQAGYDKCLEENPPGASEEELQSKYSEGLSEGREQGYREGKQAEYDAFWGNYLTSFQPDQGKDMHWFFAGSGWNDKTFYPTMNLKPGNAYQMFRYNLITDIWGRMEELGLELNFSNCTNFYQTFIDYKGTWHGVIDMSKSAIATGMCKNNINVTKIEKLIVSKSSVFATDMFGNCTKLESMLVEGTIGKKDFSVATCTNLNTKSIVSIIESLSDSTSGLSVALSQTAVNNMVFPFTSERTGITYNSWSELEATRNKWTISLS